MFNWFKRRAPRAPRITREQARQVELLRVIISRYETGDAGTFGVLLIPGLFSCHVLELPWRDNQGNISCIPAGEYIVEPYTSRKFGRAYHVKDVEGRTWILLHRGNLAGDTTKGYKTHSAGCLLLGKYRGKLGGQPAVMVSRPVVRAFVEILGEQSFKLEILEA